MLAVAMDEKRVVISRRVPLHEVPAQPGQGVVRHRPRRRVSGVHADRSMMDPNTVIFVPDFTRSTKGRLDGLHVARPQTVVYKMALFKVRFPDLSLLELPPAIDQVAHHHGG